MTRKSKSVKTSKFLEAKERKKMSPWLIYFFLTVLVGSAIFEIFSILLK